MDENSKKIELFGSRFSLDEINFEKTLGSAIEIKFHFYKRL